MMHTFKRPAAVLLTCLLLSACSLQPATPHPAPLTSLQQLDNQPPARRALNIQSWQTASGTPVLFVQASELPMFDLRLTFAAGSSKDGLQHGLASLASSLLGEGTSTSSADDIAMTFENLGAIFSASSYRDMAVVELRSLSDPKYSQPALHMLTEVISQPSFPQPAINRLKNQSMAAFAQQKKNPGQLANLALFEQLYGDHPYAHSSSGNEHSLPGLTRKQVADFYHQYYNAQNLQLVLVGDLDRQRAEQIAEQITSSLPSGQAATRTAEPRPPVAGHRHVEFDSAQTHILLAQLGIERGHPDYAALYIGNQIFGGSGFGSRLMEEVREKRGLTYGIYSYFSPMQARGPFTISVQTRADLSQATLDYVRELLASYVSEGPTEAELQTAKQEFFGSFPLSAASNSAITGQLGAIGFYNLPLDWLEQLMQEVRQLDTKQVHQALQRHLKPNELTLITVGPTVEQSPLPAPVMRAPQPQQRRHQ